VLWIHFVVNAPFGFTLGFDRASPGLMARRPRPRGESVLTTPVMVTVGLAGWLVTAPNTSEEQTMVMRHLWLRNRHGG
jgi:Ca2+-transporting ATPase